VKSSSVVEKAFIPNYLANPPFPYITPAKERSMNVQETRGMMESTQQYKPATVNGLSNVNANGIHIMYMWGLLFW
jgi:hypothetical protein